MGVPTPPPPRAPTHKLLTNARSIVNTRITWRNSRTHDGMPIGSNPVGVGGVLQILIDGNYRISEQPQNKFGCTWFGELRGWDTRALPTNLQMVDNFSYRKKIPGSKISILKKSFDHPRHLKSGVPEREACSVCLQGIKSSSRSVKSIKEIKS